MHPLWDRNQGVSRAVEPLSSITGSAEAAGLAARPDCCKRLPPGRLDPPAADRCAGDGLAAGRRGRRVRRAPGGGRGSGPRSVLDRIKWPVAFHPREDRVVEDRVERGAVGAYPGSDGSVPSALGAAARVMAAGRVDVHAADNVLGAGAEHRVGEPAALSEVLCVPLQVAEIVTQRHLVRPAAVREPRRRPDVVHAARPGGVIGLVVLRPERGQPEFPGYEPVGYREVFRNEQLIAHRAIVTRLRRQTLRGCRGVRGTVGMPE